MLLKLKRGLEVRMFEGWLKEGVCCGLCKMEMGGRELLGLGLQGPRVGEALDGLLGLVIEGKLPNDRAALLEAARRWME